MQGGCSLRAHATVMSMVTETILAIVLANLLGTAASLPLLARYDLFLQSTRTFGRDAADQACFAACNGSASAADPMP
ncbi:hypothetical protein BSZ20_28990 [Bradyrhizobium canariense]|nr:hypothetical protein BSZ20_28990 [Bradyrhizobium canariense]OSI48254.1 hypothetical protein BST67_19470 [Bradyrhizobium canariense]